MDLSLDENQQQIREAIQGFVRSEVTPNGEAWDAAETLPRSRMEQLAELGMLGIMLDEAWDGVGLGLLEAALVLEEIARGDGGLAAAMASHAALAAPHIQRTASEEQSAAWLPQLATGELLAAWAHSESSGTKLSEVQTTATKTDDGWSLSGQKRLVAGGAIADLFVVVARVGQDASAFLVPAGASGLTVSTPGMLGLRAGGLVDIDLSEVQVGADACLPGGWATIARTLAAGRVALGAVAVGLGSRAVEEAAGYALQRKQFGKAIAKFQAIKMRLADADVGVQAGKLLVHRAASVFDGGRSVAADAAKAYVHTVKAAFDAADHAIQIHGGNGYVREYHVERLWRDARTVSVMVGTTVTAKDTIAAVVGS